MESFGNFLSFRHRPWNRPGSWLLKRTEKNSEGFWPGKRSQGRNRWRFLTLTQSKKPVETYLETLRSSSWHWLEQTATFCGPRLLAEWLRLETTGKAGSRCNELQCNAMHWLVLGVTGLGWQPIARVGNSYGHISWLTQNQYGGTFFVIS